MAAIRPPSGRQILFTFFFGGTTLDIPAALGIDSSGAVVVAGQTYSADFPVTPGALQTSFTTNPAYAPETGFLTKISADG